jgi:excisionase family DNA binding protein
MQEDAGMSNQLMSIGETAKALAVSKDTIRRLIDRKELRAVRVSRRVLIPTSEVERVCADGIGKHQAVRLRKKGRELLNVGGITAATDVLHELDDKVRQAVELCE